MEKILKCARCGKELDKKKIGIKEIISCDHCHLQMKISEASQKKFRIVRYMFVLLVCLVISLGMSFMTTNTLLILLVIMSVAMIIANYSDRWCLMLTDKIFGLEYEEYHEVNISNKDRLKQEAARKKNRKGLFR